jgi:hypothetical protein
VTDYLGVGRSFFNGIEWELASTHSRFIGLMVG